MDTDFSSVTVCEHLQPALNDLRKKGLAISFAGQAWSSNCRTWVYFDRVVLDAAAIKARLGLPECVAVHTHRGTHDGAEQGLVCQIDHDGLMGAHPGVAANDYRTIV